MACGNPTCNDDAASASDRSGTVGSHGIYLSPPSAHVPADPEEADRNFPVTDRSPARRVPDSDSRGDSPVRGSLTPDKHALASPVTMPVYLRFLHISPGDIRLLADYTFTLGTRYYP